MLGLSYPLIGVAEAYAVGLGFAAAAGSLLPLLLQHPHKLFTETGKHILLGVFIMFVGVGVCGWAARQSENDQGITVPSGGKFFRGFLLVLVGGILTAALNIALTSGDQILRAVQRGGGNTALAANVVWVPVLLSEEFPVLPTMDG